MASFASNGPTQFNPYISQLPIVEEMSKVGSEKQAKYDQGIQRIQTQIDNVAGMDIMRDVDKSYLQSKMGELGNNLKYVAAGDFSNYQLTNSVGGMVNQIGKDENIQNAVYSTQRVRKALTEKDAANKSGKGSVENDWWLDKDVNGYLNNKNQKATFSGGYVPYKDIKPKMLEVLKSIHESGKDEQLPWVTDQKTGEIKYGETAAAMVEKGYKGITSGTIENALGASFDENDLRQMQISGQYQFRNYTPKDLADHAQAQYNQGISAAKTKISALQKYAEMNKTNANLYNESMASIKEMQTSIGEGGDYQNQLKDQLKNDLAGIARDPEGVKADIYKNGLIKQFANAHSWEDTTIKYLTNPYLEAKHWEQNFGLSQAKFGEDVRHARVMEGVAIANSNLSEAEYKLKLDASKGGAGFVTSGGISQESKNPQVALKNQMDESVTRVDSMVSKLANDIKTNIINNGGDPNTVVTDNDVLQMVDRSYNGPLKNAISPELRSSVTAIIAAQREAGLNAAVLNNAKTAVENLPEMKAFKIEMASDLKDHKPVTIQSNHSSITYSPEEIVQYLNKVKSLEDIGPLEVSYASGKGVAPQSGFKNFASLSKKEQLLYYTPSITNNLATEYHSFFNKNQEYLTKQNSLLDGEILKRVPEYTPKDVSLGTTDKQKAEYRGVAEQLLTSRVDLHHEGLDPETLSTWLTDPKISAALQYSVKHTATTKELVVHLGDKTQNIELHGNEINQIPEAITSPEVEIKNDMIKTGGTTNVAKGDPQGARWQNLPGIKKLHVVADVKRDENNPDIVFPVIQVKASEGTDTKWLQLTDFRPLSIANANTGFYTMDDDVIRAEVKKQLPNFKGTLDIK